jgi:meckelin
MMANEWKKVATVRCYSVPLTLIFMVFLLDGLDTRLMASPIHSPELLYSGQLYPVLTFAFISFCWLCFLLVQWVLCRLAYWRLIGDPFTNFFRLARSLNISLMFLSPYNHGLYVHGRADAQSHGLRSIAREEEAEEEEEEYDEEASAVYKLQEGCYELFLAMDFAQQIQEKVRLMRGDYETVNVFLRYFFAAEQVDYKFVLGVYSPLQLMDMAPILFQHSVFTTVPTRFVRHAMMYGIQLSLILFYLILFCVVDIVAESAATAAFVVCVIDLIVLAVFNLRCRATLKKKALVDPRCVMT